MIEPVIIGDATLFLGDCRDVLPTLGKVDAVVDKSDAVVFNQTHDKSAKRQHCAPTKSNGTMAPTQGGDSGTIRDGGLLAGADGEAIRGDAGGLSEGVGPFGDSAEVEGQDWQGKRALQGRDAKHGLSVDGGKDPLQSLRLDGNAGGSPSGQRAYEQHARQSGSALLTLPHQPPQTRMVERPQELYLVTDPPYGIGIASNGKVGGGTGGKGTWVKLYEPTKWDNEPAFEALELARTIAKNSVIFGGNYYPLPPARCWLVWDKETTGNFADCELAWTDLDKTVRRIRHLWNGLARAGNEPRGDHPSQKPVPVMKWCIGHLPDTAQTILDPFMGSGTTGVAAVQMGRKFIGIEREPKYFDIACKRIDDAQEQGDMFITPAKTKPEKPAQLFGDVA
jgi:hypothetical protein